MTTYDMAEEIERLRGIIEGARYFVGEDMTSTAYIMLCGKGLEDGIDPALDHTAVGAALIQEGCDERDVIEAARAFCEAVPDAPGAMTLRSALAKLGPPR